MIKLVWMEKIRQMREQRLSDFVMIRELFNWGEKEEERITKELADNLDRLKKEFKGGVK